MLNSYTAIVDFFIVVKEQADKDVAQAVGK